MEHSIGPSPKDSSAERRTLDKFVEHNGTRVPPEGSASSKPHQQNSKHDLSKCKSKAAGQGTAHEKPQSAELSVEMAPEDSGTASLLPYQVVEVSLKSAEEDADVQSSSSDLAEWTPPVDTGMSVLAREAQETAALEGSRCSQTEGPRPAADSAVDPPSATQMSKLTSGPSVEDPDASESRKKGIVSSPIRKPVVRFGSATVHEITALTLSHFTRAAHSGGDHLYQLLGVAGVFAMLWFTTLVYLALSRRSVHYAARPAPSCDFSQQCRSARESLEALMDQATEPCADFHRHVCKKWMLEHDSGGEQCA